MLTSFPFKILPEKPDYLAPDGSKIRLLLQTENGGLCHCTLNAGVFSCAVRHKTVSEIWYFLTDRGEIWRKDKAGEEILNVGPGGKYCDRVRNDVSIPHAWNRATHLCNFDNATMARRRRSYSDARILATLKSRFTANPKAR